MSHDPLVQLHGASHICALIAHYVLCTTLDNEVHDSSPTLTDSNTLLHHHTSHELDPHHTLGEITLHPHQRSALHRIRTAFSIFGGALLCDDVGLGKTYIALAAAAPYSRIHIVAPAILRPMWHDALTQTSLTAGFTSIESLSTIQPGTPKHRYPTHDIIIVDEAHHARTPSTNRYAALATLCGTAKMLLLSATPIHNSQSDLIALLSLIVGDRAPTLTSEELSHLIIRRTTNTTKLSTYIPTTHPVEWLRSETPPHILDAIVALPPSVPPSDGSLAQTLLTHTLARQYASSENALRTALRRRLSRANALLTTLREGRYPTTHDLQLWTHNDDTTQLAFPALTTAPTDTHDIVALTEAIETHTTALNALLARLPSTTPLDHHRATRIRQIRTRHPGHHIVAFSQYAATIHALFRILHSDAHVAALTAHTGHIATGPLSRAEILSRFAIPAHHHAANANSITLLLTTDLLSEGVNLQHASVVIHLDLPWTPAKLAQRVGRVARIGSKHREVFVYGFLPSVRAEEIIRATAILDTKSHITHTTLGGTHTTHPQSIPEYAESIQIILGEWLNLVQCNAAGVDAHDATHIPHAAVIPSPTNAFFALCLKNNHPLLLSGTRTDTKYTITADPQSVWTTLQQIQTHHITTHHTITPTQSTIAAIHYAQQSIAAWFSSQRAATDAGVSHVIPETRLARRKRHLLKHASTVATSASLATRATLAPLIAQAYATFAAPLPPQFERLFHPLHPASEQSFESKLTAHLHTANQSIRPAPPTHTAFTLIALLLLAPPS